MSYLANLTLSDTVTQADLRDFCHVYVPDSVAMSDISRFNQHHRVSFEGTRANVEAIIELLGSDVVEVERLS